MVGAIAYENCHPFSLQDATGRAWTLIHNGTLFHAPQLNSYSAWQRGETDSERALIRLVVKINEATQARGDALTPDERFQVVETFVATLSFGNKLNLLIYDGEFLYAHMNYADSLHYKEIDGGGDLRDATVRLRGVETDAVDNAARVPRGSPCSRG